MKTEVSAMSPSETQVNRTVTLTQTKGLSYLSGSVNVGPNTSGGGFIPPRDVLLVADFATPLPQPPQQIFCQARQSPGANNNANNWQDQFVIQVISRSQTS